MYTYVYFLLMFTASLQNILSEAQGTLERKHAHKKTKKTHPEGLKMGQNPSMFEKKKKPHPPGGFFVFMYFYIFFPYNQYVVHSYNMISSSI